MKIKEKLSWIYLDWIYHKKVIEDKPNKLMK